MGSEERLAEILGEWYERRDRGEPVEPADVIAKHPDLAEDLRERFAALDFVNLALASRGPAAQARPASVGAYRIVSELGAGGMGRVVLAETERKTAGLAPGSRVALKLLHPHLLERPGFFKRFLREAEVGQTVRHSNVVRTLDCDAVIQDGQHHHFLVMEYVEGQTLAELLHELERVPEELCRHIGREVAKGLQAIHEAGVVHRDLKPENVLITADHTVKVMDLGVARLQDEVIRLSQTGAFVGSLEYAAPEQIRGGGADVDGRTDLHALGLILYELSTGQHPFRGEDTAAVFRRVLEEEPRKAGAHNPQLSPYFEELVHALLHKSPDERLPSAADLAEVLEEGEESGWWKDRARALRLETKRPMRRIRIPRETALYGRDADLAGLVSLYDRVKSGDGQVVLIEGEAGIGKTRVVDEFVGRLVEQDEDLNFLFGSYPPGGAATASGAFSTAFHEQFGEVGLEESLAEHLTTTPALIPAFAAVLKGEPPPIGEPPLNRGSLQTVFVHAARSLAAERPTVLLIDDLHFAPQDGRALFASLAQACPGHRILLIGTLRPGVPANWTTSVERLDHASRVELARLSPKQLVALLKDAFRSERLAQELGIRIAEKSDGNPFFVFEIIRGLREGQLIAQRPDGTWATTQIIENIQIPSSVLDLVNARVADLAEEERDLLDVAACWGYEFDPALIGDALGLDRIAGLKRLAHIERAHRLVRSRGRWMVFDHHQVQEALYGGMPQQLREAYHQLLAETLESSERATEIEAEELDGALCVQLCDHFLKGTHAEQALRYLLPATRYLDDGYLHDSAIKLADAALNAQGLLAGAERVRVLLQNSHRLEIVGRTSGLETVLKEAGVIAGMLEETKYVAMVEQAQGRLRLRAGHVDDARQHFERQLKLCLQENSAGGTARAHGNLGLAECVAGRYDDAERWFQEGLGIACKAQDPEAEAYLLNGLANLYRKLCRHAEARKHDERVLMLARRLGDLDMETATTINIGITLDHMGRKVEALESYDQGLVLARKCGNRRWEVNALISRAHVHYVQGRHATCRTEAERGLALAGELKNPEAEGGARNLLGGLCGLQGRHVEAREHYARFLRLARERGDRSAEATALGNLGVSWQNSGCLKEAHACFESLLPLARVVGDPRGEADVLGWLGDILRLLGRDDEVRGHLEEALELAVRSQDPRVQSLCLRRLAVAAQATGSWEVAERHLEDALALQAETGAKDLLPRLLDEKASILCATGRLDEAAAVLAGAVKSAVDVGRPDEEILSRCRLSTLPGGSVEEATSALLAAEQNLSPGAMLEAKFLLWQATRDVTWLTQSRRLLDELVERAPERYRESMIENVPLHRDIAAAWAALDVRPTK